MRQTVSFIAPCYNEESVIEAYYERVAKVAEDWPDYVFEFVIVNDGSRDRSREILDRLAENDMRIKVIHFGANRGHQTALFAGIEYATGDINIAIDIDLQDPPELFPRFLEEIQKGNQVVHAQRAKRVNETYFKLITANLFYMFIKFASNIDLIKNCGDFRAFTKRARETICLFKEKHKFLRGLFVLIGFQQSIIQYDRDKRYAGETHYPFLKMVNLALDAILSFSNFPLRLILWVSGGMWFFSLLYLAKALISHFFFAQTVTGWTSIIFLQFFFAGLILFFISIIGSYVGRIYEQGQSRPSYWVDYTKNIEK